MNAVVAGGRDYELSPADYRFLELTLRANRVTTILTDGTPGVAEQVESWAKKWDVPVQRVTANFMHEGPATPEERNTTLVAIAKVVIAFPGGATDDLIAKARKARRTVVESASRQLFPAPAANTLFKHDNRNRPRLSP